MKKGSSRGKLGTTASCMAYSTISLVGADLGRRASLLARGAFTALLAVVAPGVSVWFDPVNPVVVTSGIAAMALWSAPRNAAGVGSGGEGIGSVWQCRAKMFRARKWL